MKKIKRKKKGKKKVKKKKKVNHIIYTDLLSNITTLHKMPIKTTNLFFVHKT